MKYLLHGRLTAKKGQGNELADILIEASNLIKTAKGCNLYVVSNDGNVENDVWVTEIWDSKEDHDNSLNVPGVKELIGRAMPVLEDMPEKGQELQLIGGHGV